MTSKQEAKLNMYHAVINYCDDNAAITATVPAFGTAFSAFENKVEAIEETAQLEAQVITGITIDKKVLRTSLTEQASGIAAVVYAYASGISNNTLKEEVNFSKSDLAVLRDDQLTPTVRNIHIKATDNLAALATYGITAPTLDAFDDLIDDYAAAVPTPRNAAAQRKAYATALKNHFKDADSILKDQLDKLAVQFKSTNPDFYNTYKNNRIIIDGPTSSTGIKGLITNSATGLPVTVTATISLGETEYSTTSDASGNYELTPVAAGIYLVIVTAPGFQELQVPDIDISLGEMEILNLQLTSVV